MKIVVDTNALLLPFTDGTDIRSESERLLGACEFILPSSVRDELMVLSDREGAAARGARGALKLTADWTVVETESPGDDGVLDVARRMADAVLSNDRKLQDQAIASGLHVLRSRGMARLALHQRRG